MRVSGVGVCVLREEEEEVEEEEEESSLRRVPKPSWKNVSPTQRWRASS
jgi:hypothetical protein